MAILSHPGSTQPLPKNRNEKLSLQVPYVSTPLPPLYAPRFCKIALTTVWSLVFSVGQYPAVLSSEDNDQSYLSGSSGPSSKKASKRVLNKTKLIIRTEYSNAVDEDVTDCFQRCIIHMCKKNL